MSDFIRSLCFIGFFTVVFLPCIQGFAYFVLSHQALDAEFAIFATRIENQLRRSFGRG